MMSTSLTAMVGLGIVLGTSALVQPEPAPAEELTQTEVAPGAAIPPLAQPSERVPAFVLMNDSARSSAAQAEIPTSLTIGMSGLQAFGAEGIRMPAYEPEIATGSLRRAPKR